MEQEQEQTSQTPRRRFGGRTLAALATVLAVGALGGAAFVAVLERDDDAAAHAVTSTTTSTPTAAQVAAQLSGEQIYERAAPAVVDITVTGTSSAVPGGGTARASGTGFVVGADGTIVTNHHVVDGANTVTVTFDEGQVETGRVVGSDPSTDVAVVRVENVPDNVQPLVFGDSSEVRPGQTVFALGSPFGLSDSITAGIVSAVGRSISAPDGSSAINGAIQTDAPINHGNSGGPLLDITGKVIGINSQIESDSGDNAGVGFAVPSSTAKKVVSAISSGQAVQHAYLGINPVTVTTTAQDQLGLPAGVQVGEVTTGSPAAKAGLSAGSNGVQIGDATFSKNGDVIVSVDGRSITTESELRTIIDSHEPGDKIELGVSRNGDARTVTVTLGERSA